jgi:hypothetical protein
VGGGGGGGGVGVGVMETVGEGPIKDRVEVAARVGSGVAVEEGVRDCSSRKRAVVLAPAATVSAIQVGRKAVEAAGEVGVEAHPAERRIIPSRGKKKTADLVFRRMYAVPARL